MEELKALRYGIKHVKLNHLEIIGGDASKSHLLLAKSRKVGNNQKQNIISDCKPESDIVIKEDIGKI